MNQSISVVNNIMIIQTILPAFPSAFTDSNSSEGSIIVSCYSLLFPFVFHLLTASLSIGGTEEGIVRTDGTDALTSKQLVNT